MYKFTDQQKVKFDCQLLKGEGKIVGIDPVSVLAKKPQWIVQFDTLECSLNPAITEKLKQDYPFSTLIVAEGNITEV